MKNIRVMIVNILWINFTSLMVCKACSCPFYWYWSDCWSCYCMESFSWSGHRFCCYICGCGYYC